MSRPRPQSARRITLSEKIEQTDTARSTPMSTDQPKNFNDLNLEPIIERGEHLILEAIQHLFKTQGPQSGDFLSHFTKCIENLNALSLKLIQMNKAEPSMKVLTYCRDYTNLSKYGNFPFLKVLTLNNLACLYRRINKGQLAFVSLQKALAILSESNLMMYSAKTFLNLCAIASTAGDHINALSHAKNAVIHSQEELLDFKKSQITNQVLMKEKVTTLSVSFHNMGVEYEHLAQLEEAIKWYEKSVEVLEEYKIANEELLYRFRNTLNTARDRLESFIVENNLVKKKKKKTIKIQRSETPRALSREALNITIPKRAVTPNSTRPEKVRPSSATRRYIQSNDVSKSLPQSPQKPMINNFTETKKYIKINPSAVYIPGPRQKQPIKHLRISDSLISDSEDVSQNRSRNGSPSKSFTRTHSRNNSLTSTQKIINPEIESEEIKALEKHGILVWSDEEGTPKPTNKSQFDPHHQKSQTEILKANRLSFLNSLHECQNIDNLSGEVVILTKNNTEDDNETPSSASRIKLEDLLSKEPPKKQIHRRNSAEPVRPVGSKHAGSYFDSPNASKKLNKTSVRDVKKLPQRVRPNKPVVANVIGEGRYEEIPEKKPDPEEVIPDEASKIIDTEEYKKSAQTIQKFYRMKSSIDKASLMRTNRQNIGDKILVTKRRLIITPSITRRDQTIAQEPDIYTCVCYIYPHENEAAIILFSRMYQTRHEMPVPLDELDLHKTKQNDEISINYHRSENLHKVRCHLNTFFPKLQIIDHLILLKKEEIKEEDNELNRTVSDNPKLEYINFALYEKLISKVQARIRGILSRERFKLLKNKLKTYEIVYQKIYVHVIEEPPAKYLHKFQIINSFKSNVIYAKCFNFTKQTHYSKLAFPQKLLDTIKGNYRAALKKIVFDPIKNIMDFNDDLQSFLYPEMRQNYIYKYDMKKIIKIQRFIKKRQARNYFKLLLIRSRRFKPNVFLKKWTMPYETYCILVYAFFQPDDESYLIKTFSKTIEIKPLIIPLKDVDKFECADLICNIRRVLDSISGAIIIKKEREVKFLFDIRKFLKDVAKFKNRLESEVRDTNFQDGNLSREEIREKIKLILNETLISQNSLWPVKAPLTNTSELYECETDNHIKLSSSNNSEIAAAIKIQRFYRAKLMKEFMRIRRLRRLSKEYLYSKGNLLYRSGLGLSFSSKSKAYRRYHLNEEELKRESPVGTIFLKSYNNVEIRGSNLRAKINIYYDKKDKNKKFLLTEIIMPIKNSIQFLKTYTYEISSDFKKKELLKRTEELFLDHLQWSIHEKGVVYGKNKAKLNALVHVDFEIRAKALIKRYVLKNGGKKKKNLHNNTEVLAENILKLNGNYFFVKYTFEFSKKQIIAYYTMIGEKNDEKKCYIKLDYFMDSPAIEALIKSDWIIGGDEIRQNFAPYINFLSQNITFVQIGKREEYKLSANKEVFDIETESIHFISLYLAVLPSLNFLNKFELKKEKLERRKKPITRNDFMNTTNALATEEASRIEFGRTMIEIEENNPTDKIVNDTSILNYRIIPIAEQIAACKVIQKWNKRRLLRHFISIVVRSSKKRTEKMRQKGILLKRTYKKIDRDYYSIEIYQKRDSSKYEFFARKVDEPKRASKKTPLIHGVYILDKNKLINTRGKLLIDYLLDHVDINGVFITFNFNFEEQENFVDIPVVENKNVMKNSFLKSSFLKTEMDDSLLLPSPLPVLTHKTSMSSEKDILDLQMSQKKKEVSSNKKVPKLYNFETPNQPKIEITTEDLDTSVVIPEKSEPFLKVTEALKNNLLVYNVYYNDQNAVAPSENQNHLFSDQGNIVKIDVDVSELKKLTFISPKNQNDLKKIATEIATSIKLDPSGAVLVNSKKIPVESVNILEKNVEMPSKSSHRQKQVNKKLLSKVIKFYFGKKYLLFVFYVEKSSSLTGLNQNNLLDEVFQEFEVFITIEAVCLSNPSEDLLTWEMTYMEAEKVSKKENMDELARYFATNTTIMNGHLLCAVPKKVDYKSAECIIIKKSSILIVQRSFRSRLFRTSYKKYLHFMKEIRPNMIGKKLLVHPSGGSYVACVYMKDEATIGATSWSLEDLHRNDIQFSVEILGNRFIDRKSSVLRILMDTLHIATHQFKLYLAIDEKRLTERIARLK